MIYLLVSLLCACATASTWTNEICRTNLGCPPGATAYAGNGRALGNKADDAFDGYLDVWANDDANYFTTDIKVGAHGQAWPRIFEGLTQSQTGAGYPLSVDSYVSPSAPGKWISYDGHWSPRTNGPHPMPQPGNNLQNGAYIWLNDPSDPSKWDGATPRWPYSLEINIWNRHGGTGFRPGAHPFADYHDNDGTYRVHGHKTGHDGQYFYAYYVTHESGPTGPTSMSINMKTLLAHLRDHTWKSATEPPALKGHFQVIEVSVAAEGHAGGDGKFSAAIYDMGRP